MGSRRFGRAWRVRGRGFAWIPQGFGGADARAMCSLGEKPGVRAGERSDSVARADGKGQMGLQGDVVAGKAGTIWGCDPKSQRRAVTITGNQFHQEHPTRWRAGGTCTDPDWQR